MDLSERRDRIRSYLGIEQINHGQIYSFQIAVPPESAISDISPERYQNLADSLTAHKTNLIPVIVRPTDQYSEEEEYEVIYGADWCLVAKEIGIEKLWIWSFSLTDDRVNDIKLEMEEILKPASLPSSPPSENRAVKSDKIGAEIMGLEKLQKSFQEQLESLASKILSRQQDIIEKIEILSRKLEQIELEKSVKTSEKDSKFPNYNKKTIPQLKSLAEERNIKINSKLKKAEIMALLKKADASFN
jgi:hypothetical protein